MDNGICAQSACAQRFHRPHVLAVLLQSLLRAHTKPGRVVNVASGGLYTVRLDIDDPLCERRKYDGTQQYAHVKRAQLMLSDTWAERLAGSGIIVNTMHPGWSDTPGVKTSIPDFRESHAGDLRTPEEGADTIVWLAASPKARTLTGEFFFDRAVAPKHFTLAGTQSTPVECARLWEKCSEWTAYRYPGSSQEAAVAQAQQHLAVGATTGGTNTTCGGGSGIVASSDSVATGVTASAAESTGADVVAGEAAGLR